MATLCSFNPTAPIGQRTAPAAPRTPRQGKIFEIIKIGKKKLVNRSVLINTKGRIHSYYDKIHMYDVVLSKKEKYFESKTFSAGKQIKSFNLPLPLALICSFT